MEVYRAERLGGIDALSRAKADLPKPGKGQLRIAVHAAGLHLADMAALSGARLPRPGLPFTPGFEAAGVVSATGPESKGGKGLKVGTSVIAFLSSGGLAEEAIADARLCVPMPKGLGFAQAAGLPLAYGGGLMALRRARLEAGQTLLVLGAGGQAGLAAIEAGKQLGATVIAASGHAPRQEAAAAQGADYAIDPTSKPLAETVLELTENRGADVIFDPVGGDASTAALAALAPGARMICAGFAAGRASTLNMQAFFSRDASLVTANVPLMAERDPDMARACLADVAGWAAAGNIKPRIAAQFSFEQVRHAFDYVTNRRESGAVIVTVKD